MSGPIPFEQLRLTGSMKRGTQYLGNKRIDLLVDFLVFFGPLAIFSKSGIRKTDQFSAAHFSALCRASSTVLKVIMLPSSTSCIDLFSRSRLAGELIRYSVSSCSRTIISTFWSGYAVFMEFTSQSPFLWY